MSNNTSSRSPSVNMLTGDIRDRILFNRYDDCNISESQLAAQYGVSRGSVRTALQILAGEGLIEVCSNGRKKLRQITDDYIHDVYNTRIMLETEAVRVFFQRQAADASILTAATSEFFKLFAYSGETLYSRRSDTDTEYHRSIILMSESVSLFQCWNTIEPIINSFARFNFHTMKVKQTPEKHLMIHQNLTKLILERDERAFSAIQEHIRDAVNETLEGRRIGISDVN